MANFDAQIARMRELAGYNGVNTGNSPRKTNVNESNFEYQMIGADGKSYAIVRESKYYYIKSADADKRNLAEAYDYLGGYMNRKDYEYSSYNKALKNFELKMRSINEAYNVNKPVEALNPTAKNSVLNEASEEMRKEIARQRQIMINAGLIREGKEIGADRKDDTVKFNGENPESPKGKRGDEDYKAAEKPHENKDFKKKSSKKEKEDGDTYTEKPKKGKDQLAEECCGNCEAENGVVADCMKNWGRKEPHSNQVTTCDDADMIDAPHLNEEDNEWGSEGLGEVGVGEADTDDNNQPFDQNVNEGCCDEIDECGYLNNALNEEDDEPIEDDVEDMGDEEDVDPDEEFGDDEDMADDEDADFSDEDSDEEPVDPDEEFGDEDSDEEPVDPDEEFGDDEDMADDETEEVDEDDPEAIRAEIERLQSKLDELEGEDEDGEMEPDGDEEMPVEDEEDPFGDEVGFPEEDAEDEEPMLGEDDEAPMMEAKSKFMNSIVESVVKSILKEEGTKLNDFGKHPGYRKKPMTLPQTGADKTEHGEDWNDESAHNEQPFGEKIGSSAPFDQMVEKITNAVVNEIKKK